MPSVYRQAAAIWLLVFLAGSAVFAQTRDPAGGTYVNGRFYKGGQYLPGTQIDPMVRDLTGGSGQFTRNAQAKNPKQEASVSSHEKNDQAAVRQIVGKVVGVTDGDTITVYTGGGKPVKVRLDGIDAPESKQDFGDAAKRHLSGLVYGKAITVEVTGRDKYGRTLGLVMASGQNINRTMIADGFAWHYKRYNSDPDLADLEKSARAAGRGLWAMRNPMPPWDFRHK